MGIADESAKMMVITPQRKWSQEFAWKSEFHKEVHSQSTKLDSELLIYKSKNLSIQ